MRYDVPKAMHSLPKAFRCADHRRVRSPELTFDELTSISILGPIQLQHRAAPAYTDTRSRLHRLGIQLLSQIEFVEYMVGVDSEPARDIGVICLRFPKIG